MNNGIFAVIQINLPDCFVRLFNRCTYVIEKNCLLITYNSVNRLTLKYVLFKGFKLLKSFRQRFTLQQFLVKNVRHLSV